MHDIGHLLNRLARRGHVDRPLLRSAGLSDATIGNLVRRGLLQTVHTGVYRVAGGERTWEASLHASVLAGGPAAVASHRAAARLWDLWEDEPSPEITLPTGLHPSPDRTVVHRSTDLGDHYVTVRRGVRVTKPARTLLDLGAVATRAEVAWAVEKALVSKLLTVRGLIVVLEVLGRRGRGGTAALRHVLEHRPLADKRSDSVLESFFARLAIAYGLDNIAFQHPVEVEGVVRHIDFAVLPAMVGIEVDGESVHATQAGRSNDRARDRAFAVLGWQILRVGWTDLTRRPAATFRELAAVIAEREALLRDRAA